MKCNLLAILILGLGASSAHAQALYKSIMPDGRVSYGNAPATGATAVERIHVALPPPSEAEAVTSPQEAADAKQADRAADRLDAKWRAVENEIREAERALALARAQQQAGVAPIAGEMIGNTGNSFVRPSEAYLARQQALADKVTEAQARVDRAFQARNALR